MVTAFLYVLCAVALIIVFGCFYVAWALLSDLAAGWSEACRRGRFPRQFGIGLLFAITTVVAITCFLFQGVRIDGLGEAVVMFAISLVWATAIVYGLQCMLSEYRRQPPSNRVAEQFAGAGQASGPEKGASAPSGNEDSTVELARWLSSQVTSASVDGDCVRPASTKAMRSHFRVRQAEGPKGVKFGRI